jgi:hypothetical protein
MFKKGEGREKERKEVNRKREMKKIRIGKKLV